MNQVFKPESKSFTSGKAKLEFEQNIAVVIQLSDRFIVLLDADDFEDHEPLMGQNILCFDLNGEMLWRVEDTEMTIGSENIPQSFFYLDMEDDGRITADNIDASFVINPEDGTFLDSEWKFR